MAALDDTQIKTLCADFTSARDNGSTVTAAIEALALDLKVSASTVRNHLKKAGLVGEGSQEAIKLETDTDLGIGEDEEAPAASVDSMKALMGDPSLRAMIDSIVAARLAELGGNQVVASTPDGASTLVVSALKELSKSFEKSLEIQASQQPGYQRPIPRAEVERRAAGYVEMTALLEKYKADKNPPIYILGAPFHGPSPNGPTLYAEGSEIGSYLPPAESFQPKNKAARRVYEAMIQWIGGPSPEIGDRHAQALEDARSGPVIVGEDAPTEASSDVVLRAGPAVESDADALKKHPMAHMLKQNPNQMPKSTPGSPAKAPTGPTFV